MQGASPLASPRLNPGGTGAGSESRTRRWVCLLCRPPNPAFSLLCCPHSPYPPFPSGEGGTQSLFRRGLRPRHPCAKPPAALTDRTEQVPGGLNPGGTGAGGESRTRRGACLLCRPPNLAFSVLSFPHPPYPPSPPGKGGFKVIPCKGLRPLHPQGWTGRGTGCPCRTGTSAGGGITRRESFLSVLQRPIGSAAGVPGAKPPAKSTKNLPLPAGKGGRGDGGRKEH